MVEIQDGGHI